MDSVSVDNLKEQFCNDGEENVGSDELIEHATNHQSKVTNQKQRREQDNADAEEQQWGCSGLTCGSVVARG
jgi:hypothetical protein